MIISTLCMEIWRCKEVFRSLCKGLFSAANRKNFLKAWISDSTYNSTALEEILKEYFGHDRRMLDTPVSLVSTGKVAVTTSSIKYGTPFFFHQLQWHGFAPKGSWYFPLDSLPIPHKKMRRTSQIKQMLTFA